MDAHSRDTTLSQPVFISHASADRKVADAVCEALESRGVMCWIASRNVEPGGNFGEAIVEAIGRSKVMVLVFSEHANNSNEIKKEVVLAGRRSVLVIPLRVEDVQPSGAFEYELLTRQWVDLFLDWDRAIEKLVRQIKQLVDVGPTVRSAALAPVPPISPPRQSAPPAHPTPVMPNPRTTPPQPPPPLIPGPATLSETPVPPHKPRGPPSSSEPRKTLIFTVTLGAVVAVIGTMTYFASLPALPTSAVAARTAPTFPSQSPTAPQKLAAPLPEPPTAMAAGRMPAAKATVSPEPSVSLAPSPPNPAVSISSQAAAPETALIQAQAQEAGLGLTARQRYEVQQGLTYNHIYNGAIDGMFGPSTRDAIRLYQRTKDLPETSYLDPGVLTNLLHDAATLGASRIMSPTPLASTVPTSVTFSSSASPLPAVGAVQCVLADGTKEILDRTTCRNQDGLVVQ